MQELKSQQLNTSGIEQTLAKIKEERSKEKLNEAAKLLQQARSEVTKAREAYQVLQRTKAEITSTQAIGCDVAAASEKIKAAEDALTKGDLVSAQHLLSEASSLAQNAPCGKVIVNDLRALAVG